MSKPEWARDAYAWKISEESGLLTLALTYAVRGFTPTKRMRRMGCTALVFPCGEAPARVTLFNRISIPIPAAVARWLARKRWDAFNRSFEAALADSGIGTILIDCDSPGSGVGGVAETASIVAHPPKPR